MKEIYRLIRRLGIHSNLSGYHFLARAVELVADDNSLLMGMTRGSSSKLPMIFICHPAVLTAICAQ